MRDRWRQELKANTYTHCFIIRAKYKDDKSYRIKNNVIKLAYLVIAKSQLLNFYSDRYNNRWFN